MSPYDLSTMFQNGMGSMAAMTMGQQVAMGQQMDQAKLQEQGLLNQKQQLENAQTAAMNPLNQQLMQGRIAAQSAELPGLVGQSQSLGAQGQYDTQVLASKVAARISANADQIGSDGMRTLGRNGEIASMTAQMIKQYPPYMQKQVAAQIFQKYGGDPNSPILQGLAQVPDEHVADSLATVGAGMAKASQDFLTKSALEDKKLAAERDIAQGNNRTSVEVANISAQSRVQAAKLRVQQMINTMGLDKTIGSLLRMKAENGGQLPPEYEAELQQAQNQQKEVAASHVNPLGAQMTGMPTPVQAVSTPATAPNPGIPAGAVQMLKQNPALRDQFDAKYGVGASKQILGN